jgi:hypothetical protein
VEICGRNVFSAARGQAPYVVRRRDHGHISAGSLVAACRKSFLPDFFQRFVPEPFESFDRARPLEIAFEEAYAQFPSPTSFPCSRNPVNDGSAVIGNSPNNARVSVREEATNIRQSGTTKTAR